jgi:hypothetical protein
MHQKQPPANVAFSDPAKSGVDVPRKRRAVKNK